MSSKEYVLSEMSARGVNFRAYRPADLEALVEMDDRCFAPVFRFGPEVMSSLAEAPHAVTVIAELGERIVGFAIAELGRDGPLKAGYVMTVDVDPELRRLGLGRELMWCLEIALRRKEATEMLLHVWVENAEAMRLYDRLKYKRLLREQDFYGSGMDAFLYGKSLVD